MTASRRAHPRLLGPALVFVCAITAVACGRISFEPSDGGTALVDAGTDAAHPPVDGGHDGAMGPVDGPSVDDASTIIADAGVVVDGGLVPTDAGVAADPRLVAWYPMDDEPVTGVVRDVTGNGHDANCVFGVTCPSVGRGRVGRALSFDGAMAAAKVPAAPALRLTGGFTIAVWVNPSGPTGAIVSKYFEADGVWSFSLMAAPVGEGLMWGAGPAAGSIDAVLPLSTWTHLTMTWDGATTVRLYINGSARSFMFVASPTFDDSDVVIGARTAGAAPMTFFRGGLDELRIYDAELTPAEIDALVAM